ncbi:hypothetical protein BJG93_06315 [Paraburkholderia sprentiae WSM5005]|uniref:Uncharacterized protein n=1 Tax=Paraburkholderia sprentiae WSM5005 TaxID=754502 RepID=A0A1I9YFF1_9BURK|nr:hypothetical protein [Paraburkholderia sprentiae]APA85034.1 hypothetical protein BJG93_06315 [Paraburkholderia sprentiae WSM5005]
MTEARAEAARHDVTNAQVVSVMDGSTPTVGFLSILQMTAPLADTVSARILVNPDCGASFRQTEIFNRHQSIKYG